MPKQTSSLNISYEPIPDKDDESSHSLDSRDKDDASHSAHARQPFLNRGE